MLEMICIAWATPSVPRTCCFDARENFLDKFGGLANYAGNRIERASGLIGEGCAGFDFLGAFFHDNDGFVGLGLNRLDEGCDVFRGAAGVFRELADLVGYDGETAARFSGASCFDGGVQGEESWFVP
jgi:hypothetical protein